MGCCISARPDFKKIASNQTTANAELSIKLDNTKDELNKSRYLLDMTRDLLDRARGDIDYLQMQVRLLTRQHQHIDHDNRVDEDEEMEINYFEMERNEEMVKEEVVKEEVVKDEVVEYVDIGE